MNPDDLTDAHLRQRCDGYLNAMDHASRHFRDVLGQAEGGPHHDALAYLYHRGYPPHVLDALRVGWCPFMDAPWLYLANRIVFPICDQLGRVRGFGGRNMPDALGPKYVNTIEGPYFQKRRHLFGLAEPGGTFRDCVKAASRVGFVLVCEGYTDVLAFRAAGVRHAVAAMGTALTPYQATILARIAPEVRLCFDADVAGEEAARRATRGSYMDVRWTSSDLPPGVDPGDLARTPEGLAMLRALGGL